MLTNYLNHYWNLKYIVHFLGVFKLHILCKILYLICKSFLLNVTKVILWKGGNVCTPTWQLLNTYSSNIIIMVIEQKSVIISNILYYIVEIAHYIPRCILMLCNSQINFMFIIYIAHLITMYIGAWLVLVTVKTARLNLIVLTFNPIIIIIIRQHATYVCGTYVMCSNIHVVIIGRQCVYICISELYLCVLKWWWVLILASDRVARVKHYAIRYWKKN